MRPTKNQDRRKDPRKPCRLAVSGFDKGSAFKGFAKNISRGGAFIETSHAFAINEDVFLSFFDGDKTKVIGKVAWTASDGAGIAFKGTPQRLATEIERLVPYLT